MRLFGNAAFPAWRREWASFAESWDSIQADLAGIKPSDIEGLLDALEALPEARIDNDAVPSAAFCYGVVSEASEMSEGLQERAARVLQRLAISRPVPTDVLRFLVKAADRFPLKDDVQRYHVARRIAGTTTPSSDAQQAARRRQLQMAANMHRAEPAIWQPLAESLMDEAGDMQEGGDYGRARRGLEEAIELCKASRTGLDDWGLVIIGRGHSRIGDICRQLGEPEAARVHFEQAKCALTRSGEGTKTAKHARVLIHVLTGLSELAKDTGDYSRARCEIELGLDLIERKSVPEWARCDLLQRLVCVVRAEKGKAAAQEILEEILADHGTIPAAIAGHEAAGELWAVYLASRSVQYGEIQQRMALQDRLIQLLNLDPEMVEWRVRELDLEEGVQVDQAMPSSPWDISGPTDEQEERERWRSVQVLQRLGEMIVATKSESSSERSVLHMGRCARFRGFRIDDVDAVFEVMFRAQETSDVRVTAGPPGNDSVVWNLECPSEDYYNAYYGESGDVDMVICDEAVGTGGSTQLDFWIMRGLRLLLDALVFGKPDLRRCEMPRGVTTYLDYLLGERDHPADRCGRFFIPTKKHKETCGHGTCETYHGRLQPLEIKLMQRAEELAERDCRAAGCLEDFYEMWREASDGRDAKAALARFREMLKGSSRGGNSS